MPKGKSKEGKGKSKESKSKEPAKTPKTPKTPKSKESKAKKDAPRANKSKEGRSKEGKGKAMSKMQKVMKEKTSCDSGKSAGPQKSKKPVTKRGGEKDENLRKKDSDFQCTVFEAVHDGTDGNQSLAPTMAGSPVDFEEQLRREEEALLQMNVKDEEREKLEAARKASSHDIHRQQSAVQPNFKQVRKHGEDVVFASERRGVGGYVPGNFDPFDPRFLNKDVALKVSKERFKWQDSLSQVKLKLTNTGKGLRVFKVRCSDASLFRCDPAYGTLDAGKHCFLCITVTRPPTDCSKIKVESLPVEPGDHREPKEMMANRDPSKLQYTHIEVHPSTAMGADLSL